MDDFQRQVQELLEKAMAQPGVVETMQLYESQKTAVDAHAIAEQAIAPQWITFSSTSSTKSAF